MVHTAFSTPHSFSSVTGGASRPALTLAAQRCRKAAAAASTCCSRAVCEQKAGGSLLAIMVACLMRSRLGFAAVRSSGQGALSCKR